MNYIWKSSMIKKWLFDRMMAAIGLLALWPVFAIVAILIKVKWFDGVCCWGSSDYAPWCQVTPL